MNVQRIPSELNSVWVDVCTPWCDREPDKEQILRQVAFAKARGAHGVNCLGPLGESQALAHWQLREVVQMVCANPFALPAAVTVDQPSIEVARWVIRMAANAGAEIVRWSPPPGFEMGQEGLGPWLSAVQEECERMGVSHESTQGWVTERNAYTAWLAGALEDEARGEIESAAEKWIWILRKVREEGRVGSAKELKRFLTAEGVLDCEETKFPYL